MWKTCAVLFVAAAGLSAPSRSIAQETAYTDALLDKVRAAARAVPVNLLDLFAFSSSPSSRRR